MFNFLRKLKKEIDIKNEEKSYKHLLKDYTTKDIDFLSIDKKTIIFKHSQRCIVSRTVLKDFMKFYDSHLDKFYFVVVDVIDNRNLSNQLAEEFKIIHQSPQVLIIDNCKCIYHESHNEINFNYIDKNF